MSHLEPRVWSSFETTKNGQKYKIRVERVTPDLLEDAIQHMVSYFLEREPITKYNQLVRDPDSLADIKQVWRENAKQGASIVAVLEEPQNGPPHNIVGVNMTYIESKNEKMDLTKFKGEKFVEVIGAVAALSKEGDTCGRYGVDKYLSAIGLSVHPDYHGLQIGLKLLEAREQVCKGYGLSVTSTVFTAPISQHLARKVGFELMKEYDYANFEVDGKIPYRNLEGKISVMGKRFN